MMMKNRILESILLVLAVIISLGSCSKKEADNAKPLINLISPSDHEQFHPGEQIRFEAEFTDNVELNQFKIDIHFDDGHDHKILLDGEWDYEFIGQLAGTSQRIDLNIQIPEDALHGEYHFIVFCTDKAGNEAFVNINIEIEDDHD